MHDRPWFLWDLPVTEAELRDRLHSDDPDVRAQWQGRVLREARFGEVWTYMTLGEVLRDWQRIKRHLGRSRARAASKTVSSDEMRRRLGLAKRRRPKRKR